MAAKLSPDALNSAPKCDKCTHHHGKDEKCKLCGHQGRLIIFPGPEDRHPPPPTFHVERFDTKTEPVEVSFGNWRLGVLMRTRVLVEELKMVAGFAVTAASGRRTEVSDLDKFDDGVSRHVLGFLGDAPVSYVRWRPMRGEEIDGVGANYMVAAVDRFVTLKGYRGKGFGKSILAHCLTDILQFILEMGINVQRISMFIPIHPECINAAHVANASGLHAVGEPRAEDPTHTTMPSFASEGIQEFAITSEALLAAYHSAVEGSGGESYAAAGV